MLTVFTYGGEPVYQRLVANEFGRAAHAGTYQPDGGVYAHGVGAAPRYRTEFFTAEGRLLRFEKLQATDAILVKRGPTSL